MREELFLWPGTAGTPEMQEQFPAGAWMARHLETKDISVGPLAGNAGAISGGCMEAHDPEKRNVRQKCRSSFPNGACVADIVKTKKNSSCRESGPPTCSAEPVRGRILVPFCTGAGNLDQ